MRTAISLVWFKKDLRLQDHQPLQQAIAHGLPILLLFVYEPKMMQQPDADVRHYRFVHQSLQQLQTLLHPYQHTLTVAHGSVLDVLAVIAEKYCIQFIFSHEETGHLCSYERDKQVAKYCKLHGIVWKEYPTNGVIRRLQTRYDWNKKWFATMQTPIYDVPLAAATCIDGNGLLPEALHATAISARLAVGNKAFQPGGVLYAQQYLQSFLSDRMVGYRRNISKPAAARWHCSRLSPYLAYGNLSIKQVYQAVQELQQAQPSRKGEVAFFSSRLLWHCHFIQKLESQTSIETHNLNSAFDGIRQTVNEAHLTAWQTGNTGVPMIDACMRCLQATGYLNFRMRSMLVSFVTHHLWQPWQAAAPHLAQLFLDYEPGIHYPQFQMQAGTTGINTIRIYNPVKQGKEHDPDGSFVKKWLPELAALPPEFVHEPWLLQKMEQHMLGISVPERYQQPIVSIAEAATKAKAALWSMKSTAVTRNNNTAILQKHTQRHSQKEDTASTTPL